MKFLFVANFDSEENSGTAGTLLRIGRALQALGHAVTWAWRPEGRYRFRHARIRDLVELPELQLQQVANLLEREAQDVVIVSQPYAYRVYEVLAPRHPATLFLNRTHGWEQRYGELMRRHRWGAAGGMLGWMPRRAGAARTAYVCRRTARSAQGVIAASSEDASFIRERYATDDGFVGLVRYGVDPIDGPRQAGAAPRMVYSGTYDLRKGQALLEQVLPVIARDHPAATLTFVVQDGAVAEVTRRYRPHFGERLTVRPWLPRAELARVLLAHDVFLAPSYFEGFGKGPFEAMAAGLCVVGSRVGCLHDLPPDLGAALTFECGNAVGFEQLLRLALEDADWRERVGRAGREYAGRFTWESTARQTVEFCERRRAALGLRGAPHG